MPLGYKGTPEFKRDRDLTTKKLDFNKIDKSLIFDSADTTAEDDLIFDNIARVYIKGEDTKKLLSSMDPAGYIPVEEHAAVVTSILRLVPGIQNKNAISFGLYKEACDYLADRANSIDEDFLVNYKVIDPSLEQQRFVKRYKRINDSSDDWITQFLELLIPLAGLQLMGYLNDMFMMNQPRITNPDNEVRQWSTQGFAIGIALLIEMGINAAALIALFDTELTNTKPELKVELKKIINDPSLRRSVLEDAGFNYNNLQNNQKFNDYKAIKDYSLKYICDNPDKLNYDHWIAYLRTVESQTQVKSALAMAPIFSTKWRNFQNKSVLQTVILDEENRNILEDQIKASLSVGLKSYLSNLYQVNNDTYNKYIQVFTLAIDDRYLCCILYFIGEVDSKLLTCLSSILKLALYRTNFKFKDLIKTLIDNVQAGIVNLLAVNLNQFIDQIIKNITDKLFSIPESDLEATIKYCASIELILKALDFAIVEVVSILNDIISYLNSFLKSGELKTTAEVDSYVERKYLAALVAFLDVLANKLEFAKLTCVVSDENTVDNIVGDAALDFVNNNVNIIYPVMKVPEDIRRKHFRDVGTFTTKNLKIEVPGTDPSGQPEEIIRPLSEKGCTDSSVFTSSTEVAKRIAQNFRDNI